MYCQRGETVALLALILFIVFPKESKYRREAARESCDTFVVRILRRGEAHRVFFSFHQGGSRDALCKRVFSRAWSTVSPRIPFARGSVRRMARHGSRERKRLESPRAPFIYITRLCVARSPHLPECPTSSHLAREDFWYRLSPALPAFRQHVHLSTATCLRNQLGTHAERAAALLLGAISLRDFSLA